MCFAMIKTVIIILLTANGLLYHPVVVRGNLSCVEMGEAWRTKYTTHTWEKIKGDEFSHGFYVDDGELKDSLMIGFTC